MDSDTLVFTASNPLAVPTPQRMDFGELAEDTRSPMEQLMVASCMSREQIMQLGDEDLIMLMVDHNLSISAKNDVLLAVAAARTGKGPQSPEQEEGGVFVVGARVQGLYPPNDRWYDAVVAEVHDGGERYTLDWDDGDQEHRELPAASVRRGARADAPPADILAERMEEHREAKNWLKHPRDTQLRYVAFAFMVILMCTIYQRGVQHFTEATAETDLHLFRWAQEHGDVRTLRLHGPTEFSHPEISKTWYNLPPHHGLHLDFRLWAVGQCGSCEGAPPEAIVQIDNSEHHDDGRDKTLERRTNYYVDAAGSDSLDAEKRNSAFSWEFSAHAAQLPPPGPKSNSAAFAEVSINQRHTANSVTLIISQDWHDGQDYVDMIHGVGTQQLMLDAMQLSVSTCAPPPKQPALPAPMRRSRADQAADRALASAALAAATANITFFPGEGIGSADEFMGQAESPSECASLVASRRPSANGVSYSAPDTHIKGCWAEYGMVDREISSGSLKFVSAFFGDLNGGEPLPPKWVAGTAHQAHVCMSTIGERERRLRGGSATRPTDSSECQAAAEAAGLSLGGADLDFINDYPGGGCYTYSSGAYFGMAFWSTNTGKLTEQQQPLFVAVADDRTNGCKTCSELGWQPTPTGSEFVCAESDDGFDCHNELTFDEAETVCLTHGARLCTAAELINLEGSGTGCGHDGRLVWSSSTSEEMMGVTCSDTERVAVKGRFDGDMQNIRCVDMGSTRYVYNLFG